MDSLNPTMTTIAGEDAAAPTTTASTSEPAIAPSLASNHPPPAAMDAALRQPSPPGAPSSSFAASSSMAANMQEPAAATSSYAQPPTQPASHTLPPVAAGAYGNAVLDGHGAGIMDSRQSQQQVGSDFESVQQYSAHSMRGSSVQMVSAPSVPAAAAVYHPTMVTGMGMPPAGVAGGETKRDRHIRLMMERLARIDQEFITAKEGLYQQKANQLKKELHEIQNGTHPEFAHRLRALERERDEAVSKANLYCEYQLQCAEAMYRAETEQAKQDYMVEKNGLRDKMLQEIEDRRKKLRQERENLTIDNDASIETPIHRYLPRKLRRRNHTDTLTQGAGGDGTRASKRRPQQQGPAVALTLKEDEILEDLFLLSKLGGSVRATGGKLTSKRSRPGRY